MIKCEWAKRVEISGNLKDCIAEYGVLSEQLIKCVPETKRLIVAKSLAKQLELAIENAIEGRCENAGS